MSITREQRLREIESLVRAALQHLEALRDEELPTEGDGPYWCSPCGDGRHGDCWHGSCECPHRTSPPTEGDDDGA